MTDPLEATASELVSSVHSLNESIRHASDLRDDLSRLSARTGQNRRLIRLVIAGFTLDVILTLSMALVGEQAISNSNRLDSVVRAQHDSALCPLYKIFISSDTPANRDRAAAQGQDVAERDRQFAIIRQSYVALKCEDK